MAYGQQQPESRKISINLSNISTKSYASGATKFVLEDGKLKYNFFGTKKDGSISKAGEGWDKLKLRIGDSVEAEVVETPDSFQDPKTGKTVNYTDRRVLFFYTDLEKIETAQTTQQQPAPAPITPSTPASSFDEVNLVNIDKKLDKVIALLTGKAQINAVLPPTKPAPVQQVVPAKMPEPEIPIIDDPAFPQMDDEKDEIRIEDVPF